MSHPLFVIYITPTVPAGEHYLLTGQVGDEVPYIMAINDVLPSGSDTLEVPCLAYATMKPRLECARELGERFVVVAHNGDEKRRARDKLIIETQAEGMEMPLSELQLLLYVEGTPPEEIFHEVYFSGVSS